LKQKQKQSAERLAAHRAGVISCNAWPIVAAREETGMLRIATGDTTVEVWLTTGSWQPSDGAMRMNDWAGFLRYMAVMG